MVDATRPCRGYLEGGVCVADRRKIAKISDAMAYDPGRIGAANRSRDTKDGAGCPTPPFVISEALCVVDAPVWAILRNLDAGFERAAHDLLLSLGSYTTKSRAYPHISKREGRPYDFGSLRETIVCLIVFSFCASSAALFTAYCIALLFGSSP